MSKTNLGKVSICPKGEYDSTVTYQPLDMVSYNGGSFIARTECAGIEPTAGEVWQEVAKGENEKIELIQSVTIETAAVVYFQNLSLSYAYIEMILPISTKVAGGNVHFFFDGSSSNIHQYSWISGYTSNSSYSSIAWAEARRYADRYFVTFATYNPATNGAAKQQTAQFFRLVTKPYKLITGVRYTASAPVGMTINLYGIRA